MWVEEAEGAGLAEEEEVQDEAEVEEGQVVACRLKTGKEY